MEALWTYWNRFVFITLLLNVFALDESFLSFTSVSASSLLCVCLKTAPSYPLLYLPQRREGVFDQPPKVGISLVKMLSPANLQNHWPKSSFDPKITGSASLGQDHEGYICPVLKLTGRYRSKLHFRLNFSMWIILLYGSHFYHNFCNYLKYHVCLFSLLQPINVYLINVKKKKVWFFTWSTWVKKTTKEQI